jgi:hypothetical protein
MVETLIKRVRQENFPSVTMMDRIEASLRTREQLEEWAEVLLEKLEGTRYPSIAMLNRFDATVARLG